MMETGRAPSALAGHWCESIECCDAEWEAAYLRFEDPATERRKFASRFRRLGVFDWPRHWRIADLFCGRCNGLAVLEQAGFTNLCGVDLSESLLRTYRGSAELFVGDCRALHFDDSSLDAVIIQGGLHHLPSLPEDLERATAEIHRVLRSGGRVLIVEPWLTPFLRFVHCVARQRLVRRNCNRLDALQAMIEREHATYFRWLSRPDEILSLLTRHYESEVLKRRFGKLHYLGRKP